MLHLRLAVLKSALEASRHKKGHEDISSIFKATSHSAPSANSSGARNQARGFTNNSPLVNDSSASFLGSPLQSSPHDRLTSRGEEHSWDSGRESSHSSICSRLRRNSNDESMGPSQNLGSSSGSSTCSERSDSSGRCASPRWSHRPRSCPSIAGRAGRLTKSRRTQPPGSAVAWSSASGIRSYSSGRTPASSPLTAPVLNLATSVGAADAGAGLPIRRSAGASNCMIGGVSPHGRLANSERPLWRR